MPDAGLTCSHGWFDVAVHVTVPDPALRQPHDLRRRLRHERRAGRHRPEAQRVLSSAIVGSATNVATTVQLATTEFVVNTRPARVPPHVPVTVSTR